MDNPQAKTLFLERWTDRARVGEKKSESPTGIEPRTIRAPRLRGARAESLYPMSYETSCRATESLSSRSSVYGSGASAQCSRGHGFDYCRGLGLFVYLSQVSAMLISSLFAVKSRHLYWLTIFSSCFYCILEWYSERIHIITKQNIHIPSISAYHSHPVNNHIHIHMQSYSHTHPIHLHLHIPSTSHLHSIHKP